MAQYPIPQFIEEEGKIVFFLTYRQFFELVGGGGVIVLLYLIIPSFLIFIVLAILVAVITAAIAFFKVNNMSLPQAVLTMLGFAVRQKTYTWKKKESVGYAKIEKAKKENTMEAVVPANAPPPLVSQPSKLQQIQKMVDTKK